MRRRLFNLAAAVSMVLCVATAALWVRSYWIEDVSVYFDGGDTTRGTELYLDGAIGRGKVLFQYQHTRWNEGISGVKYERYQPPSKEIGFHRFSDRVVGPWPAQFLGV